MGGRFREAGLAMLIVKVDILSLSQMDRDFVPERDELGWIESAPTLPGEIRKKLGRRAFVIVNFKT
jgi:hypothetical protein